MKSVRNVPASVRQRLADLHGPGFAHGPELASSRDPGIHHPGVCPAEEKAQ
jgi:hypothetical protein